LLPVASILPSGLKATLVGPAPFGICQVRLRADPSLTPAAVALGLVLLGVGLAPLVVGVGVRLALPLRGGVVGPRNPAAALCRLPADAGGVPPVLSETTRMTAIAAAITVAAAAIAAGFRRDRRAARRPTGRAPPGDGPTG
jgi:F0F1-type ATP synthase membrane subunit c/vacuolar-type H+-ATPase subunit K